MKGINKMTFNEIFGLIGGLMMTGMLFYYLYTVNKHQKEILKELNK